MDNHDKSPRPSQDRFTRRQFLEKGFKQSLGTYAFGVMGANFLPAGDQQRLQELLSPLNKASGQAEQEGFLSDLTHGYLKEYTLTRDRANRLTDRYKSTNTLEFQATQDIKKERQVAALLLEQGVALVSGWAGVTGEAGARFNGRNLRLDFEGNTLATSENARDFHLALNLVRAKLRLAIEDDPQKRSLYEEDYQDLIKMAKLDPQLEISEKAWVIMPEEHILPIARYLNFLDRQDLPLPARIIVDPTGERENGVGANYALALDKRFPEKSQVITLFGFDPSHIDHEGGHYLSELHRISERAIGLKRGQKFPNHQRLFDFQTARAQRDLLLDAKREGRLDLNLLLSGHNSPYGATTPGEDLAEVTAGARSEGPFVRAVLAKQDAKAKGGVSLGRVRYNYFTTDMAGGEEYSFDGRMKRPEIAQWESGKMDQRSEMPPLVNTVALIEKGATDNLRRIDGFSDAEVKITIPGADIDFGLLLLQPTLWEGQIGGVRVSNTSAAYPMAHRELRGKFEFKMDIGNGEETARVDTARPDSINEVLEKLKQSSSAPVNLLFPSVPASEKAKVALSELGVSDKTFTQGWSSSKPYNFINHPDSYFVNFEQDGQSKEWKVAPLDARRLNVHYKNLDSDGDEAENVLFVTALKIAKKNLILNIDSQGKLVSVYANGIDNLKPKGSSQSVFPSPQS